MNICVCLYALCMYIIMYVYLYTKYNAKFHKVTVTISLQIYKAQLGI